MVIKYENYELTIPDEVGGRYGLENNCEVHGWVMDKIIKEMGDNGTAPLVGFINNPIINPDSNN